MVWTIIGIIILSGIYRLYQSGKQREAEQKKKAEAAKALLPEIEKIQKDLNNTIKRQNESYEKIAQANWDKCVEKYNLSQHLKETVSFQNNNGKGFFEKYVWEENNRLYNFMLRPSLQNVSKLGDTLQNYSYYENVEDTYRYRMIQRFMNLSPNVQRSDIQIITFPRYSVRDYFAISINDTHRLKIKKAITNLVNGIWGSGKKPMCRLPQGSNTALY